MMPSIRAGFIVLILSLLAASATATDLATSAAKKQECRCIPGDACWPTAKEWKQLNSTLGGRLIETLPVAHVCHDPDYDEAACKILQETWDMPETHIFHPSEFNAPYFQNQSCDPFTPREKPCTLGNYASYSIRITGKEDVKKGLRFAEKNNIRVTIKNTGHDYIGKTSGKGSLNFWMANLKEIEFIEQYKSKAYKGPAMRLASGVLGAEAYKAAFNLGYRVVGGDCPTVGIAGGFAQGGGHSPISGTHGYGADNILAWEVVTPQGEYLVTTPEKNEDLYWALSGGGGGTFGITLSMTVKLHEETPVAGAALTVSSESTGTEGLWEAIDAFHHELLNILDAGSAVTYQITNDTLRFYAATAVNKTIADVEREFAPYLEYLTGANIPYEFSPTLFESYYEHLDHYFGPFPYGHFPISQLTGGRIVPRETVANKPKEMGEAFRKLVSTGNFYLANVAFNGSSSGHDPDANAMMDQWRDLVMYAIVVGEWDWEVPRSEMVERQAELTDVITPLLRDLMPDSGVYLNEGNFEDPNWQYEFYGKKYEKLLKIKKKYDPKGILYAHTAVGSELWSPDSDGRLCSVKKS